MRTFGTLCSAVVLAALAYAPATAQTAQERAKLQTLSPELREQVLARLGPGQTVDGVLETMLLNEVSSLHAEASYFVVDDAASTVTVVYANGERAVVRYDPVTWMIIR